MNMIVTAAAVTAPVTMLDGDNLPIAKTGSVFEQELDEYDSISEAIDRHRRAHERHVASLCEDELEKTIPKELRKSSFHDAMNEEPDWRVPTDNPLWIAHIEEGVNAWNAEQDAAIELVSMDNVSLADALRLLDYAVSTEKDDLNIWPELLDDEGKRRSWHFFMMRQVAEAIRQTSQKV